jgi:hypothetical protein
VNTEVARETSGQQDGGHEDEERGVAAVRDTDLPRRSVEILRDLGLSKEKIVAYHRRFPTPPPTSCGVPIARVDNAAMIPGEGIAMPIRLELRPLYPLQTGAS